MIANVTPGATLRPRVFKSRHFDRFARRVGLDDATLMVAAIEVRTGRHDADLGGGVFKKRIAREGGGKSGGFRTIVVCSNAGYTVLAYGYAKSDGADPTPRQVEAFKSMARELRDYPIRWAEAALIELEVSLGN